MAWSLTPPTLTLPLNTLSLLSTPANSKFHCGQWNIRKNGKKQLTLAPTMVVEDRSYGGWPPIEAPLNVQRDEHWSNFDSSVNAVSFGFVATAILISMFLIMAIFERFLRPPSPPASPPSGRRARGDIESQQMGKLGHPSPKVSESFC